MINLPNIEMASRYLVLQLKREGHKLDQIVDKQYGKHKLIMTQEGNKFYLLYKREPFNTWYKQFPQLNKVGFPIFCVDSVNREILNKILQSRIDFIFIVYQDGLVLKIDPTNWKDRCRNNNLIRIPIKLARIPVKDYSGKQQLIEEETASCFFTEDDIYVDGGLGNG